MSGPDMKIASCALAMQCPVAYRPTAVWMRGTGCGSLVFWVCGTDVAHGPTASCGRRSQALCPMPPSGQTPFAMPSTVMPGTLRRIMLRMWNAMPGTDLADHATRSMLCAMVTTNTGIAKSCYPLPTCLRFPNLELTLQIIVSGLVPVLR